MKNLVVAGPSTQRPQKISDSQSNIDADSEIEELPEECHLPDLDSDDADDEPNFDSESRHNSNTEQEMCENEDENIAANTDVCEDINDVRDFESNINENNDPVMLHADEVIENVVGLSD